MDAASCRSQLHRLLRDETSLLTLLQQQLESEHGLLTSNDIDALDRAGAARQDTVQRLLRVDDERRQLAGLLGKGRDNPAMAGLLAWCDPEGSLAEAYAQCAAQAQHCRDQNTRNGALVAARLARVSDTLRHITPAAAGTRTYAPSPAANAPRVETGRMVQTRA
jgi:flagellar biosynthesis/type III secretory pathway chaperone